MLPFDCVFDNKVETEHVVVYVCAKVCYAAYLACGRAADLSSHQCIPPSTHPHMEPLSAREALRWQMDGQNEQTQQPSGRVSGV